MKVEKTITKEQLECLQAVQKINNKMHDKGGWDNHNSLMSMLICGYHFGVTLNLNSADTEIQLYNSSQDDRIYYEKSEKYEKWEPFLKRKFRQVKEQINNIKL